VYSVDLELHCECEVVSGRWKVGAFSMWAVWRNLAVVWFTDTAEKVAVSGCCLVLVKIEGVV
jgi:hypothetical protein